MQAIRKDVIIIGGGIAGLWCAWELAAAGLESVIVESAKFLGGHAAKLCCKATERCQRCGACLLEDVLHNVGRSPSITSFVGTTVRGIQQQNSHFTVTLSGPPESVSQVEARGVVIASGFSPFDPSEKPRFGYGRVEGVMTGLELESMLRDNNLNTQDLKKVAFIQCVGSRDPKLGRNYCSRVCCGYGLRLARLMRNRLPEIEPTMFYMDIQSFDRDFERRLAAAAQEVRLIRSIPSEVRSGANGKPELVYHGPDEITVVEQYDLVVLSVGISPGASTTALIEMLALKPNSDGFLGEDGEGVSTATKGVFVAGTAQGPRSIEETVSHAIRTAGEVASYIGTIAIGESK